MSPRRLTALVASLLLLTSTAGVLWATDAAQAAPPKCKTFDPVTKECTKWFTVGGDETDDDEGTDTPQGDDGKPFTGCLWEPYRGDLWGRPAPERPAEVSADAVYSTCFPYLNGVRGLCPCVNEWREPGEAPPSALEVAQSIPISVKLHKAEVETDPPGGLPSFITIPTFVRVTNWEGTVTDSGCIGGVCVTVTADPTLTFDPGEPGAGVVTCEDGGTQYVDGGPSIDAQAAPPGACAHAYEHATGIEGREDVRLGWPASVTITWDVTWAQTAGPQNGPTNGAFADESFTTTFNRPVAEVQTVVGG